MREKLIELLYDAMFFEGYGRELCEQQADHLIANGVVVQEWISVKDRLPEHGDRVLVAFAKRLGGGVASAKFKLGVSVDGWYCDGTFYELGINFITHWMPLPEPPKGEQHERS